jgi:hypothetical protein
MGMLAVLSIDWEAVGHWSMLAQGLFAFLTFLATVVYVGFTYHIMRWAVGQGRASIQLAETTQKREQEREGVIEQETITFLAQALRTKYECMKRSVERPDDMREVERAVDDIVKRGERVRELNTSSVVREGVRSVLRDFEALRVHAVSETSLDSDRMKERQQRFTWVLEALEEGVYRTRDLIIPEPRTRRP